MCTIPDLAETVYDLIGLRDFNPSSPGCGVPSMSRSQATRARSFVSGGAIRHHRHYGLVLFGTFLALFVLTSPGPASSANLLPSDIAASLSHFAKVRSWGTTSSGNCTNASVQVPPRANGTSGVVHLRIKTYVVSATGCPTSHGYTEQASAWAQIDLSEPITIPANTTRIVVNWTGSLKVVEWTKNIGGCPKSMGGYCASFSSALLENYAFIKDNTANKTLCSSSPPYCLNFRDWYHWKCPWTFTNQWECPTGKDHRGVRIIADRFLLYPGQVCTSAGCSGWMTGQLNASHSYTLHMEVVANVSTFIYGYVGTAAASIDLAGNYSAVAGPIRIY